jgi:hypothetical protein
MKTSALSDIEVRDGILGFKIKREIEWQWRSCPFTTSFPEVRHFILIFFEVRVYKECRLRFNLADNFAGIW